MAKTFPRAQRLREDEGWEETENRKQSLCPLEWPHQVDNNKYIFVDLSLHTSLSLDPSAMSQVSLSKEEQAGIKYGWTPRVSEVRDSPPQPAKLLVHILQFNRLDFSLG